MSASFVLCRPTLISGLSMRRSHWKNSQILALVALIMVTAIWGSTFIVVQNAVSQMPVMDFLGIRFTVAAVAMIALRPTCLRGMTRQGLIRSAVLGVVLGLGFITQTYGLQHTSAAVSGFITGMFVILTPIISWMLLRRKAGWSIWFSVALATIGLGLLSLRGWCVGRGELLTLMCALFFALHIVGLGEWAARHEAYGLAFLQITVVAVISMVAATPGGITLPPNTTVWGAVILTAILASAIGFLVQTWAQTIISPTRTAVTLTMEPVFAGFFAVVIGGDHLTARIIVGAACVLIAMFITNLKAVPYPRTLEP
jgi:drug/metabolite transporter (DMT)-like permease